MVPNIITNLPKQITPQHISNLHTAFLNTSSRFTSYNFREYFIRRSNLKFNQELPTIIKSTSITSETSTDQSSQETLQKWWKDSIKELMVLERASVMNRLYEAPKLVVEGEGRFIVAAGGGAGMEQS
ncbi:uncharacterized protein MELLADRAFT_35661 [Melampsora larici-populina 98AG31]|uniref:Uncharacterized protein n=1 Tax=Melampsora larici-populina (strain 98AG31 / pathotype 3-4-7) TaxID=747676 RepID=F4RKH2_MELLP|nr:uncharacterized protein MELLADRAFT_35661 [Melampsora larici-populina 98AG31]EGG07095.1 hypothetical protein MELLADRAFT_35661 [Melampsora larici-populina 98AG31]